LWWWTLTAGLLASGCAGRGAVGFDDQFDEAVHDACSCGNPVRLQPQGINVTALDQDDKTVAWS
jgi:hypothetical protein